MRLSYRACPLLCCQVHTLRKCLEVADACYLLAYNAAVMQGSPSPQLLGAQGVWGCWRVLLAYKPRGTAPRRRQLARDAF